MENTRGLTIMPHMLSDHDFLISAIMIIQQTADLAEGLVVEVHRNPDEHRQKPRHDPGSFAMVVSQQQDHTDKQDTAGKDSGHPYTDSFEESYARTDASEKWSDRRGEEHRSRSFAFGLFWNQLRQDRQCLCIDKDGKKKEHNRDEKQGNDIVARRQEWPFENCFLGSKRDKSIIQPTKRQKACEEWSEFWWSNLASQDSSDEIACTDSKQDNTDKYGGEDDATSHDRRSKSERNHLDC